MSVEQNDDYQPGLLCPACANTFGGSHDTIPMKTPGCDHLVCANCAGTAPASTPCFVCKQDTTSKKYTASTGICAFSDKKLLELHPGLGAARGCADCVALGDPPQLAVSLCVGCKGEDRPVCEDHASAHRRHAALQRLAGAPLPRATHCAHHPGSPITRMCMTCSVAMCAECVLQASMHPKASHSIRMLDAAAAALAGKLETLMPTLDEGSASLAALSEKSLLQKAVMTNTFEASVESLKASVVAFVAKLLAAQDALIHEARTTLNAQAKVLDDQASVFSVSAAQVRAGLRMCEEVLADASQRVDPLALAVTLDSASSLAHLAGRRTSAVVPPSIVLSMDLKPLEAALAGICHVRQSQIDASLCEVDGPGLEGFVIGDAADVDVIAQNYVDVTLKDARGAVVADVSLDDLNVFVTDGQPATGAGSDVSLAPVGTVAKSLCSSGCIRVSFSASTSLQSFALHFQLRNGDALACSPVIVPNVTVVDRLPGSVILHKLDRVALKAFYRAFDTWFPPAVGFQLLYRSSRDGPTPAAFHRACDGKGASLTLIRTTSGHAFGGYSEISWSSTNAWIAATDAFLFTIVNPYGDTPSRFPLSLPRHPNALRHHPAFGPTFGGGPAVGYDIHISGNDATASSGFGSQAGSTYTCFPAAFKDDTGFSRGKSTFTSASKSSPAGNEFVPEEIEVWAVA